MTGTKMTQEEVDRYLKCRDDPDLVEIHPVDLDEEIEDDVEYLCLQGLIALGLLIIEIEAGNGEVKQFMRVRDNETMFRVARFAESWIENGGGADDEIDWRAVADGTRIGEFTAST